MDCKHEAVKYSIASQPKKHAVQVTERCYDCGAARRFVVEFDRIYGGLPWSSVGAVPAH